MVFAGLSLFIAVIPAYQMQETRPLPSMQPLTDAQVKGLDLYISEGCVACHTQQVRNIEMDRVWGGRPSLASDYYYSKKRMDFWRQSPSVLGSERTGPDLTNVGRRQAAQEWHLLHLYNPRIVVRESVMPGYPWLFSEKREQDIKEKDVVVPVPAPFLRQPGYKIVASKEVLTLVEYLVSLKQADTGGESSYGFIPSGKKDKPDPADGKATGLPDGALLYTNTCAACHQADGKGLPGAFPPLAGSAIVNDTDPSLLIRIILQGYDAREEYGIMAPFGDMLSNEEIAAIATHERSSWGNQAPAVTAGEVDKIRAYILTLNP
ncbi:MAG: cbb3-type cytochrome c oxidase subunit II [Leadbetterella sp.]|nr:cbb3-type cytochrome c oxidase subunit II [Leadbetterella sp.]